MLEVRIADTIAEIAAPEWDHCFPDATEGHASLLAIERSAMAGFAWHYLLVTAGDRLIAAAPAFVTTYDVATMLGRAGQRIAAGLGRAVPTLIRPRLACLGSPCTEVAPIGFVPRLDASTRADARVLLLRGLDRLADRAQAQLVALKDVARTDVVPLTPLLATGGYERIPGLPIATLDIDFTTIADYLSRLSAGTRRDMRRKLRSSAMIRIEKTRDVAPVIGRIMALYHQTRDRAAMKFETLTPDYFLQMLADEHAFVKLYWHDDTLVAANLLIERHGVLLDKFFCMDVAGRHLNPYFLSWFENLEHCLARGLHRYQAGQAAYTNKVRLGCRLEPTAMYFRHRNPLCHRLLGFAAPRLMARTPAEASG